jgi:acyl-CoA thioester hydrolase
MKKIISKIEIRFNDVDIYGHINNAIYLSYLEQARIYFFNELIGKDHNWMEEGIIVANVNINYLKPIVFGQYIIGEVWLDEIGNKSFKLAYKLYQNDVEMSNATTTMVCMNFIERKSIAFPEKWKKIFYS